MSKLILTDEVNTSNTATVHSGGQVRIMPIATTHTNLNVAATSATVVLNSGACYLKSVIIGSLPATASVLLLLDTATSAASAVPSDISGANKITKILIPAAAAAPTAQAQNIVVPLEVYCTTGLTYNVGGDGVSIGNLTNVTIVYQDL